MLVVAKDRYGNVIDVHFLPEKGEVKVGEDIKVETPVPLPLRREGERVTLHLPNGVIVVNGSINLTHFVLEVVDVEKIVEYERLWKLEGELFREDLSNDVRKFLRLYTALTAMKLSERGDTYSDALVLLASRLLNIDVHKLGAERKRIVEELRKEIDDMLRNMSKEDLIKLFGVLIG